MKLEEKRPGNGTAYCCEQTCRADASSETIYEIVGECGQEDVTHACTEHVGALLGYPHGYDNANGGWHIHALPRTNGALGDVFPELKEAADSLMNLCSGQRAASKGEE